MTTATRTLRQIGLVIIPTDEQDRAIDFYVGSLGFEKRTDIPMGNGYRWVEVYPPDGSTGIALAPPPPGKQAEPRETGITLTTGDVEQSHRELKDLGVDVDEQIARMGDPVPPMFWLRDRDGNTLLVVETQGERAA